MNARIIWIPTLIMLCLCQTSGAAGAANNPRPEDIQYQEAMQWFNQHDWNRARKAFVQFQNDYPRSRWKPGVQLRLADLETDPLAAESAYAAALAVAEGTEWGADARWALANTYLAQSKYQNAGRLFVAISQTEDPRKVHALFQAGICHYAQKNYSAARALFCRVEESAPDGPWALQALVARGDADLELRRENEALTAYEAYLRRAPDGELAGHASAQKAKITVRRPASVGGAETGSNAPAAPAPAPAPAETGHFTIQVGAFTQPAYAELLVKKLRQKGYSAYRLTRRTETEEFHQVRVGNYPQRQFAEDLSQKLESHERLPTLILPYEGGL